MFKSVSQALTQIRKCIKWSLLITNCIATSCHDRSRISVKTNYNNVEKTSLRSTAVDCIYKCNQSPFRIISKSIAFLYSWCLYYHSQYFSRDREIKNFKFSRFLIWNSYILEEAKLFSVPTRICSTSNSLPAKLKRQRSSLVTRLFKNFL